MYLLITILLAAMWIFQLGIFPTVPIMEFKDQKIFNNTGDHFTDAVLIVLDAFRYDQIKNFPVFKTITSEYPLQSRLLLLLSTAPTMTTQKLQVLMTGTHLISNSIWTNFMIDKLQTDNIINKVNTISIGDDTWGKLFNVKKQIKCQSFKVSDLHSCDQLVINNLERVYNSNQYQLVIGHMLGLDHIGHTFSSIDNLEYTKKLKNISDFIYDFSTKLRKSTVLIVVGDHGMKDNGNHGGASQKQIQTAFFIYSHKHIHKPSNFSVKQYQIAATLSVLLDLDLPKQAIGEPIYQVLPQSLPISIIKQRFMEIQKMKITALALDCQSSPVDECVNNIEPEVNYMSITIGLIITIAIYIFIQIKQVNLNFKKQGIIWIVASVNFSWGLLKLQTTFLFVIFCIIIVGTAGRSSIFIIFMSLLICQLQAPRIDEYSNLILYSNWLYRILTQFRLTDFLMFFLVGNHIKKVRQTQAMKSRLTVLSILITFLGCYSNIKQIKLLGFLFAVYLGLGNPVPYLRTLLTAYCMLPFTNGNQMIILLIMPHVFQRLAFKHGYQTILKLIFSEICWLSMGLRNDYSSIDVNKSFVFSDNFYLPLNTVCIVLHLFSPYMVFLSSIVIVRTNNMFFTLVDHRYQQKSIYQAHSLPLAYLITASINLVYNIHKILFTVICRPLWIFAYGKCLLGILVMSIYNRLFEQNIQQRNPFRQ